MKTSVFALTLAFRTAFAIPPSNFGFPESPNDTALVVVYPQSDDVYISVTEGRLFGIDIPTSEPVVAVNGSAYSSIASYSGLYTVIMVDPDASYPQSPTNRFILHWLQTNMSTDTFIVQTTGLTSQLIGSQPLSSDTPAVVPYNPPQPPTDSSAHRYILYAFQQPSNFTIPSAFSGYNAQNRTRFNLTEFIAAAQLGTPAAANYYYCSRQSNVNATFNEPAGSTYPGGNGDAVFSGDPGATALVSATATSSAGQTSSGSLSQTSSPSGSAEQTSTSSGIAAKSTGVAGLVGAGLLGLAAIL